MSEDKDVDQPNTPTGDAVDAWLEQKKTDSKERIKQLYSLGAQIIENALGIDREKQKSPPPNVTTATDKDGKIELITLDLTDPEITQPADVTSLEAELQVDSRRVDYVCLLNRGFPPLAWTKEYFGDRPVLGISFGDHSKEYECTYAFTGNGGSAKRLLILNGDAVVGDKRTPNLTPDEINKADVAMRMLKSHMEIH